MQVPNKLIENLQRLEDFARSCFPSNNLINCSYCDNKFPEDYGGTLCPSCDELSYDAQQQAKADFHDLLDDLDIDPDDEDAVNMVLESGGDF